MLALLALVAASLATAGSPPAPITKAPPGKIRKVGQSNPTAPTAAPAAVHAIGYRLSAKLAPSTSAPSTATGQWDGILVHTIGTVRNGAMPSAPGCSVTGPRQGGPGQAPPRQSGLPHQIKCKGAGAVPPFSVPAAGQHWILGWRLTYANLSSAVTGANINITVAAGAAPVASAPLCSACVSGKFGRTVLTDDQAAAILKAEASVVVSTANNPAGEISGPIVQVKLAPTTTGH